MLKKHWHYVLDKFISLYAQFVVLMQLSFLITSKTIGVEGKLDPIVPGNALERRITNA